MAAKKPKAETQSFPFTAIKQGEKTLLLTSFPADLLARISYVAVRRQSDEEGAIQRPLSEQRIKSISKFALDGGDFPVCMILNWVRPELLKLQGTKLQVTVGERAAQLI